MSPDQVADLLINTSGETFVYLFFKAFAIFFAFSYLVYAILITRQAKVMNEAFKTKNAGMMYAISFIQVIFGLILIAISFILI